MSKQFKAYIFDLDGTLLDSLGVWEQIDKSFLSARGISVPSDYVDAISSFSLDEAAKYTIKRFGLSDSISDLRREWTELAVYAYGNTVPLKPYAKEYLLALSARGAKMAVATSSPEALYMPALRNHGIESLFDVFCSSDEVEHGKTRPDIFFLAAKRLNVAPSECIVFEDIPEAIASAKSIGMTVYGVYDEYSKAYWETIKKTADGVIYDFKDAPLT